MYSFAQRSDTQVWDEPLYAYYLESTGKEHPAREETIRSMSINAEQIIEEIILGQHEKPVSFFKQMSHHLLGVDWAFLKECQNIVYIRNPEEIIFSYSKVIPQVQMEDIGIELQWELIQFLEKEGAPYVVLDSTSMLKNPEDILSKLCAALEIPFESSMLSWPKGARPEDGIWAKHWYKNVHQSTGFQTYQKKEITLNGENRALADKCRPIFEKLLEKTIR